MAYTGEQVMLYLVVQPAGKVGHDPAAGREVGCSLYLVHSPFVFYRYRVVNAYIGEFGLFHYVGQLEYNG